MLLLSCSKLPLSNSILISPSLGRRNTPSLVHAFIIITQTVHAIPSLMLSQIVEHVLLQGVLTVPLCCVAVAVAIAVTVTVAVIHTGIAFGIDGRPRIRVAVHVPLRLYYLSI